MPLKVAAGWDKDVGKELTLAQQIHGIGHDIVLLGGSSGSLDPLRKILGALPAEVPATFFVVVHLAPSQHSPTALIANHTALAVKLAEDGMPFSPGEVYIAPSDRHLALQDGVMRVFRGPRENGARPAIDVLFRSAAVSHGARVVGVLLSGSLSDGSLGLAAVKRCGGVALVQAPTEAQKDEMPRRALRATPVDHCLPAAQLAGQLAAIIPQPAPESPPVPEDLRVEARLALRAADPYHRVEQLGQPIPIVCPECSGPLTEVRHHDSFGFRCHIGHAYSPEAMLAQHSLTLERALWVAFRTLKERGVLLSQLAEDARARGLETSASGFEERLRELEDHAASVHRAIATVSELPSEEHTWNGE